MMLNIVSKCPEDLISYELPDGSKENPNNPDDTSCFIFHADGAGLSPCGDYAKTDEEDGGPCHGAEVGGACWFYGAAGQTCVSVCDNEEMAYSPATMTYAGSGGSDTNCGAVLDALGADGAGPSLTLTDCDVWHGLGCMLWVEPGYEHRPRCNNIPTTAEDAYADARRACACE